MGKTEKQENKTKKQKHFWKDFKAELKKVIWPTRSQVVNNTIIVLVIVIIVTAIVFMLDLAFEALNTYGVDKLKSMVQNQVANELPEENNTDTTNNEVGNENIVNNEQTNSEQNAENNVVADDTSNVTNVSE